jgi:hypothetical protein
MPLQKYSSFDLVKGLTDGSILSIEFIPIDRWPSVRKRFYDRLSILFAITVEGSPRK